MTVELDISFAEFFRCNPHISTRLSNLILRAADDAATPFPTVLDYWEDRWQARRRFFLIDGFGAKSAAELERRIAAYLAASAVC